MTQLWTKYWIRKIKKKMELSNSLVITAIVLFIHATTWDGMIFEKVKDLIKPEGMLYKPIYGCPICMTPWYGTAIYWLTMSYGWVDWLLTVGTAAGFSVV